MARVWLAVVLFVQLALPVWGAGPETLPAGGEARVVSVVDGDTVLLDDGREVRLVGVQAPKLPLGRPNFTPWPLGEEAKAFVETHIQGQRVTVRLAPQPQDRHGRVLAHVLRADDGWWVQGGLLEAGLARVYTFPDNRVLGAEMLTLERLARADGRGIWALPYYALRTPENVFADVGTFQIVEGRVADVARVKDRIYMNFGADWRTDFTVKMSARVETLFTEAGVDVMALKGVRVRVRGWVDRENGPMIALDHPERLEVLER